MDADNGISSRNRYTTTSRQIKNKRVGGTIINIRGKIK